MKNDLLSLPGYNLCEYLLILSPHEDLAEKIKTIKKDFCKKYKVESAKCGKPHITLVKFSQLQMMEERIIRNLKSISETMPVLNIEFKDFGSFPTHTIYINIETKSSIQQLVKKIKPAQSLLKYKQTKAHFIDNPHLSIARGLTSTQYEQAWLEYSHLHFTGKFIAKNMALLRRSESFGAYKIVQLFEFMNKPVVNMQGSLF